MVVSNEPQGDWMDPAAARQPVVIGTGSIEREGLMSTGRVARDTAIAGTIVGAAIEIGRVTGYLPPEVVAQSPNVLIAATGMVTVAVRFLWRWIGRYVV
jgi:hypothetical protein